MPSYSLSQSIREPETKSTEHGAQDDIQENGIKAAAQSATTWQAMQAVRSNQKFIHVSCKFPA